MKTTAKNVIALGMFDGVHLGHRRLLAETVKYANANKLTPCAYTFDNHPLSALNENADIKLIYTTAERINAIKSAGINDIILEHFTLQYACASPREFVVSLLEKHDMRCVVVGYNYTFGKHGSGNCDTLVQLSKELGFDVIVVPPVIHGGVPVSSTLIRKLIENGDVSAANELLGSCFTLSGIVVHGRHVGSTIGFPTANINWQQGKLLPCYGTYETLAEQGGVCYPALTNISDNPTFCTNGNTTVETHILDFDADIYGQSITVSFIRKIRDVQQFSSQSQLIEQINRDVAFIKNDAIGEKDGRENDSKVFAKLH